MGALGGGGDGGWGHAQEGWGVHTYVHEAPHDMV
jgi:hypothetical protein